MTTVRYEYGNLKSLWYCTGTLTIGNRNPYSYWCLVVLVMMATSTSTSTPSACPLRCWVVGKIWRVDRIRLSSLPISLHLEGCPGMFV
eukprot:scaffold226796_cov16-Prasinocladus_malaysianus.AAC.2